MTWTKKKSNVSGDRVIDSSIGFAKLSDVKDEDDMVSNSATHLATQQSIKRYVDDRRQWKSYYFKDQTTSLVNGYTDLTSSIFSKQDSTGLGRLREIEFSIDFQYNGIPSSVVNDIQFVIEVNSGLTSYRYETFTATHVVFTSGFHTISFDGDVTGYFSENAAFATTLTTNTYSHKFVTQCYYSTASDKTFVKYSNYFGSIMSSGTATVYVSWNQFTTSSSTWKAAKYYNVDTYQSTTSTAQYSAHFKCTVGVTSDEVRYRLRAREFGTYDSSTINEITATLIDTPWED